MIMWIGRVSLKGQFPPIDQNVLNKVTRLITFDNVRGGLISDEPYKASGLDGFPAVFYQKNWNVVGQVFVCFYL